MHQVLIKTCIEVVSHCVHIVIGYLRLHCIVYNRDNSGLVQCMPDSWTLYSSSTIFIFGIWQWFELYSLSYCCSSVAEATFSI